ncbi:MAG TPA: Dabb family protein [Rubrobacteraceae bacterium]|nr:Dabb family protein [Rubrobacteraceae bacterium]
MIDHLVLIAVRDDCSPEEVADLVDSARKLKDSVPGVVDLSIGEDFSGRGGEYTHGLFARFEDRDGLQGYLKHPDHIAVVEKLDRYTNGRLVLDYEA